MTDLIWGISIALGAAAIACILRLLKVINQSQFVKFLEGEGAVLTLIMLYIYRQELRIFERILTAALIFIVAGIISFLAIVAQDKMHK